MSDQNQEKPNLSLGALSLSFIVPMIAWYLGAFVFFGQFTYLLLLLCLFSPFTFTLILSGAKKDNNLKGNEFLSLVGGSALAIALVFSTPFSLSLQKERINMKTDAVAEMMGRQPQVKPQLDAIGDWRTARENITLFKDVLRSNIQKDAVSSYLTTATLLDVDTSFVLENGMVRKKDETDLYNTAIRMAKLGNKNAITFLNP